jgi:predicted porin
MKKSLLALAALTAFAGVASAQSSVTLFGIVDAAARSTKNGNAGTINSLVSGGGNTSRLGFRGIEDLGGGLRAGFWLEGQVDTDTGGTGFNFARRATVSLIGGFGELRLGRDFVPTYSNWGAAEIFGYVGVATTANLRAGFLGQGSIATAVRSNNQIMYFLPAMGGLYGNINVGAGELTGDKYIGGRLGYAAGPLNIGGAYGKTERGVAELETMNVSASFKMGFGTLFAGYENSEYTSGATSNDIDLITVGLTVPLGQGVVKAQYTKADSSTANFDATMFGLGYVYNLSKRTSLYTSYGSIDNGGNRTTGGNYTAGSAGPAGMFRGEKSTGYEFGITHTF